MRIYCNMRLTPVTLCQRNRTTFSSHKLAVDLLFIYFIFNDWLDLGNQFLEDMSMILFWNKNDEQGEHSRFRFSLSQNNDHRIPEISAVSLALSLWNPTSVIFFLHIVMSRQTGQCLNFNLATLKTTRVLNSHLLPLGF